MQSASRLPAISEMKELPESESLVEFLIQCNPGMSLPVASILSKTHNTLTSYLLQENYSTILNLLTETETKIKEIDPTLDCDGINLRPQGWATLTHLTLREFISNMLAAESQYQQGALDEALKYLDLAEKNGVDVARFCIKLLNAKILIEKNQTQEAITLLDPEKVAIFHLANEKDAPDFVIKHRMQMLFYLAQAYYRASNYNDAKVCLELYFAIENWRYSNDISRPSLLTETEKENLNELTADLILQLTAEFRSEAPDKEMNAVNNILIPFVNLPSTTAAEDKLASLFNLALAYSELLDDQPDLLAILSLDLGIWLIHQSKLTLEEKRKQLFKFYTLHRELAVRLSTLACPEERNFYDNYAIAYDDTEILNRYVPIGSKSVSHNFVEFLKSISKRHTESLTAQIDFIDRALNKLPAKNINSELSDFKKSLQKNLNRITQEEVKKAKDEKIAKAKLAAEEEKQRQIEKQKAQQLKEEKIAEEKRLKEDQKKLNIEKQIQSKLKKDEKLRKAAEEKKAREDKLAQEKNAADMKAKQAAEEKAKQKALKLEKQLQKENEAKATAARLAAEKEKSHEQKIKPKEVICKQPQFSAQQSEVKDDKSLAPNIISPTASTETEIASPDYTNTPLPSPLSDINSPTEFKPTVDPIQDEINNLFATVALPVGKITIATFKNSLEDENKRIAFTSHLQKLWEMTTLRNQIFSELHALNFFSIVQTTACEKYFLDLALEENDSLNTFLIHLTLLHFVDDNYAFMLLKLHQPQIQYDAISDYLNQIQQQTINNVNLFGITKHFVEGIVEDEIKKMMSRHHSLRTLYERRNVLEQTQLESKKMLEQNAILQQAIAQKEQELKEQALKQQQMAIAHQQVMFQYQQTLHANAALAQARFGMFGMPTPTFPIANPLPVQPFTQLPVPNISNVNTSLVNNFNHNQRPLRNPQPPHGMRSQTKNNYRK